MRFLSVKALCRSPEDKTQAIPKVGDGGWKTTRKRKRSPNDNRKRSQNNNHSGNFNIYKYCILFHSVDRPIKTQPLFAKNSQKPKR